jgi:hypothetical protein
VPVLQRWKYSHGVKMAPRGRRPCVAGDASARQSGAFLLVEMVIAVVHWLCTRFAQAVDSLIDRFIHKLAPCESTGKQAIPVCASSSA